MDRYAIIGTRTPDCFQHHYAQELARALSLTGLIQTGGANGIDSVAMSNTVPGRLRVLLPWDTFNQGIIPSHAVTLTYNSAKHEDWRLSVVKYHPHPSGLTPAAYRLHARNYGIVAYPTLVKAVFAFPDKYGQGGTAQGVRVAKALHIPVFELCKDSPMALQHQYKDSIKEFLHV